MAGCVITRAERAGAGEVAAICRAAADRSWRAYHAIERFSSGADACRRRMLLDHFGDDRADSAARPLLRRLRPGHDRPPGSERAGRPDSWPGDGARVAAEGDRALFDALRAWRAQASEGKPAYTVAHNATLAEIASSRPRSLAQLAAIRGVGPSFIDRHGTRVLEVVQGEWPATSST